MATPTATFHKHEIELLIIKALAMRNPFTQNRTWNFWRSQRMRDSDMAFGEFAEFARAALMRFRDHEKEF